VRTWEAIAQAFAAEGASAVFGMMGTTNQHFINGLERNGVPVYEVRHEGVGLAMAEGWHLVTGEPGVCTTTSGPGVTQLATTMVVAARARTPLVAFCGDENADGTGNLSHRMDQAGFAAGIECGFLRIKSAETACDVVQQAFHLARTQRRPIMISAPLNFQLEELDDPDDYRPSTTLIPSAPPYPDPAVLRQAAETLAGASRPVIIVGRGAIAADAGEAVQRLAERTGAIVATTLMAMSWPHQPDDFHVGIAGLYSSRTALELFGDADCVVAVGTSMTGYTTMHGLLFSDMPIIHVEREPGVVMGNGRLADSYLHTDARQGLELLDELLSQRGFSQAGYRTDDVRARLAEAVVDPVQFEVEPGTLDHREVTNLLDELLPDDIGLVIGGGHSTNAAIMQCRAKRPFTLINKYFGSMSKGLGGAIGACIAVDRAPTALIEGEAGFIMHLAEVETAVRYGLPLLMIALNNEALGHEFLSSAEKALNPELARVRTPDLGQVGVSLGGRGHLVRTLDEFRTAVAEFVAQPAPTILDVRITPFVESVQSRRLHGHDEV
jgi:acetolactate synthase-1/2/3 large subunit